MNIVFLLLYIAWYIVTLVQMVLGFGTAYRHTKNGGDNGIALFGWMLVFDLAALVPGLGIWLWRRSREMDALNP